MMRPTGTRQTVAKFHPALAGSACVRRVAAETGRSVAEVVVHLMGLWVWAADESDGGHMAGFDPPMLVGVFPGTDAPFWEAVARAGVLERTAGGLFVPDLEGRVCRNFPC